MLKSLYIAVRNVLLTYFTFRVIIKILSNPSIPLIGNRGQQHVTGIYIVRWPFLFNQKADGYELNRIKAGGLYH